MSRTEIPMLSPVFVENTPVRPFTGADVLLYGAAVHHFGAGFSDEVLEALSWVFLNRRAGREPQELILQPEHASPDWMARQLAEPVSPEQARVFASLARVLAGTVTDPTSGATRFHCHRETPAWADRREAKALIGPYLFYGAGLYVG